MKKGFFIVSRLRFKVIVASIAGMITAGLLWINQEPVYGIDGIVRYNNALDPHLFITYTVLSIILTAAIVDIGYWLATQCKKQCFADTEA